MAQITRLLVGQRSSTLLPAARVGAFSASAVGKSTFSDRLLAAVQDLARSGRRLVESNALSSQSPHVPSAARAAAGVTQGQRSLTQPSAAAKSVAASPAVGVWAATTAPSPAAGATASQGVAARASGVSAVPAAGIVSAPDIARAVPSRPLSLSEFPRPAADNGRGIHWIPTLAQPPEVVDRFVGELQAMKVKWCVLLNEDTKVGANDYLVSRLKDAGIEPVMRVYTPGGAPIAGDVRQLVQHYLPRGVRYYQLYNEPNLRIENQGRTPDVERYLNDWLPAAKAVAEAGGYPGFGALAPGGDADDLAFLDRALDSVIRRGERATLDRAWLSLHNYIFNRPLDYAKDSNGFLKYQWYDDLVRQKLGRSLPVIGTEGGSHVGAQNDGSLPALTGDQLVQRTLDAYAQVKGGSAPYYFAYTHWLVANEAGGGRDPDFSHQALFGNGFTSPLVDALKRTA